MLCVEWEKGKMTSKEVMRAMGEMVAGDSTKAKHLTDLAARILDKDLPVGQSDQDQDAEWERKYHGAD